MCHLLHVAVNMCLNYSFVHLSFFYEWKNDDDDDNAKRNLNPKSLFTTMLRLTLIWNQGLVLNYFLNSVLAETIFVLDLV